jgi:hydrogenase maturation protease
MIHIICYGNLFMGDDGYGIHVYNRLSKQKLSEQAKVFDAGTSGIRSLPYYENCDIVYIIDAINYIQEEGKIHTLTISDLQNSTDRTYSNHLAGVNEIIDLIYKVPLMDSIPEIVFLGTEIKKINRFTERLSYPIQRAVIKTVQLLELVVEGNHGQNRIN